MKLCKNVKVYGIERIIFDNITEYSLKNKDENCTGIWYRVKSPRNRKTVPAIANQQMAKNITSISNTREYEVSINGNTIYVTTIAKKETHPKEKLRIAIVCACPRHAE